jgi:hypothetical protein
MKRFSKTFISAVTGFFLIAGTWAVAAGALPSDWKFEQPFQVGASGLVKLSLPMKTLDAARPALEDLRLYDDAGNAVPYFLERPAPTEKAAQSAKSFQVSLERMNTVIVVETGLGEPVKAVTLETPAFSFVKAVRVDGSPDRTAWRRSPQAKSFSPGRCQPVARFIPGRQMEISAARGG